MITVASPELDSISGLKSKYSLAPDKHAPILYLIHGRAGNMDVMWTFRRCIPEGFSIIAPQAFLNDEVGGYSWWPIGKGREETIESVAFACDKIATFVSNTERQLGLKPKMRVAFGFSQGAALLSSLIQYQPALFESAALLAGFVFKRSEQISLNKKRIFVAHGSKDEVVPFSKAEEGAEYLRSIDADITFVADAVGHKVGTQGMAALKAWMLNGKVA